MVDRLEEFEGFNKERQIVAVDGAEVLESEFLKENGGPEHAFCRFFGTADDLDGCFAGEALDETGGAVVQVLVVLVGDDAMQVASDGPDIAVDGPLVVVQHHDHAPGLLGDVVHCFKRDAVGECSVARDGDHVLVAAGEVARHGHAQRSRKRSPCMAGAVAVVLALGAQHEPVQAAGLADGLKAVETAGEDFVHVSLVAEVEEDPVLGSIEDGVESQRELDDAEIGTKMAAGFRKSLDQAGANLLGELGQLLVIQGFQIGGRMNGLQQ